MAGTPVLAPPDRDLAASTVRDVPVACDDHGASLPEFPAAGGLVIDAAAGAGPRGKRHVGSLAPPGMRHNPAFPQFADAVACSCVHCRHARGLPATERARNATKACVTARPIEPGCRAGFGARSASCPELPERSRIVGPEGAGAFRASGPADSGEWRCAPLKFRK